MGMLTAIPGTVVAANPTGLTNIDVAVSADCKFLYMLNTAAGAIGAFAIGAATGILTNLSALGGLPRGVGLNGIAAN
jgi:6-phosphogluconolactonase